MSVCFVPVKHLKKHIFIQVSSYVLG